MRPGPRRTGTVYSEFTNKGRRSLQATRGGIVRCYRWVGEIVVHGRRFRFRSTSHANVCRWLRDMLARYGDD